MIEVAGAQTNSCVKGRDNSNFQTAFMVGFSNRAVTLHIDQSALLGISQTDFAFAGIHCWYPSSQPYGWYK